MTDSATWSDLTSLRFTDTHHGVLVLGPVGVGKTHLASALGHIGIRRRISVHLARADKLFTRLRAARLDNTLDAEMRRLARVGLLILDDFALRSLDATQTSDFYELVVERHRKASTVITSNREPAEWLTMMSDSLLAQSAVDRLTSGAHTLIIEGPSYRQREHPRPRATVDPDTNNHDAGVNRARQPMAARSPQVGGWVAGTGGWPGASRLRAWIRRSRATRLGALGAGGLIQPDVPRTAVRIGPSSMPRWYGAPLCKLSGHDGSIPNRHHQARERERRRSQLYSFL